VSLLRSPALRRTQYGASVAGNDIFGNETQPADFGGLCDSDP